MRAAESVMPIEGTYNLNDNDICNGKLTMGLFYELLCGCMLLRNIVK